eukprot:1160715-Pelagomonas_calceolata.AAC.1
MDGGGRPFHNTTLETQRLDQLHQVRVTSDLSLETRHPWHKARDDRNNAKLQWKVEQKVE